MVPQCDIISIFEQMARRRGQTTGNVYEQSGWWYTRYRVDGPDGRTRIAVPICRVTDPETGKAIGKREAKRRAYTEYISKIQQANMRPSSSRTMREFFEQRFEPDVIATLKTSGKVHYRYLWRKHIAPGLGAVSLRDVSPSRVQSLVNEKLAWRGPKNEKLSIQTVMHIKKAIGAIVRHAKAMGWFAGELPTDAVRLPEMRTKERHALTWDQVVMLAKALPEEISTLTILLTLTGLRIGEAMGLRRKRLNLTNDAVVIDGEVIPPMCLAVRESYIRGQWQSVKQGSVGNVPIPEWFAPQLLRHLSQSKFQAPDDPVFAAVCGSPMDQHNVAARVLRPIMKKLGLHTPGGLWHRFRVTNATVADQAGLTVTERQRILRHAATEMTLRYSKGDIERTRERLAQMVDQKRLN